MTTTVAEIERAFPDHQRSAVTQEFADMVNHISVDPPTAAEICENFFRYAVVLREGKFKPEDYLNAVAYVSYKAMGCNNQEAYARTFQLRYQALMKRGASTKNRSSHVAMYNRTKLVNLLKEKARIAVWIFNQDEVQMAIKTQIDLMMNAKSETVRMQAANSLLTHLRPPERMTKADRSVSAPKTSGMNELRDWLDQLAMRQRALIGQGSGI